MARLNHGTLLENLVVLEATRVIASEATTLEFAHAFSMPPLTEGWHKTPDEPRNNPRFNLARMTELLAGTIAAGAPTSYSSFLLKCLRNAAGLPVVPYAGQPVHQRGACGPNGALLAALLRRSAGQSIRIWSNDLARTGRYHDATHDAASQCSLTNDHARALLDQPDCASTDAFCAHPFPQSVTALREWSRPCDVRIGFLDPDAYVGMGRLEPGKVDSTGHAAWLNTLRGDGSFAVGIMFFASQHAPGRPALVARFHADAVAEFPRSIVFRHGIYMVGVKLPDQDSNRVQRVVTAVREAWAEWSSLVGKDRDGLSVDVDGQYGVD